MQIFQYVYAFGLFLGLLCVLFTVGWCMDRGALRHITYDRFLFSKFEEQEGGMSMELRDDVSYYMREVGSISFQTP